MAQELYEAKLISYPRTNSRCLTAADAQKAPGWIKALAQGQLAELQPFVAELRKRWPVVLDKRFVNDKEVEDHSALVPTENPAKNLQGDKLKVYELIARRFLAAYFPERIEGRTTIVTKIGGETFKTSGTVVRELGFSAVDPAHGRQKKERAKGEGGAEEDEDSGLLPPVAKAEEVQTKDLLPRAGKTSPPKRMTEGDLLGAMQSAGKELDDEELKGAMKDCGLGTPATRANIIETLLKRGFVERTRNILQPTGKGDRPHQIHPGRNAQEPSDDGGVGGEAGADAPRGHDARRVHERHPGLRDGTRGPDQGADAHGPTARLRPRGGMLPEVRLQSPSAGLERRLLRKVRGDGGPCVQNVLRCGPEGRAPGAVQLLPGARPDHPQRGKGVRPMRQVAGGKEASPRPAGPAALIFSSPPEPFTPPG